MLPDTVFSLLQPEKGKEGGGGGVDMNKPLQLPQSKGQADMNLRLVYEEEEVRP